MTRNPLWRTITIGLWVLALAAAVWVFWAGPNRQPSLLAANELGRGSYRLTTHDGQPFTEASLRQGPSLVFFGFTHCPDVCPTTLTDIADWREATGADLRTFFVSVDPERDTPEILKDYVGWLPGALGVSGSVEDTEAALRAFGSFAKKGPVDEKGEYAMDHSAFVLMFHGDGRFAGTIPYQTPPEEAAAKLAAILRGS